VGIDLAHRRAQQRCEGRRVAVHARDDRHRAPGRPTLARELRVGEVHLRPRFLDDGIVADVSHEADNGNPRLVLRAEVEALPDRVRSRPVPIGHRLVDDRDVRAGLAVARNEEAAPHQPHPHRLEVAGRDDLPVAVRVLPRRLRAPLERDGPVADRAGERQQAGGARRADAVKRPDAFQQVLVEGNHVPIGGVVGRRERHASGEHPFWCEAEVHAAQFHEGPNEQHGGDQEDRRERRLGDGERVAEAGPRPSGRPGGAAVVQGPRKFGPRQAERRRQPGKQAGDHAENQRERENADVESRVLDPRDRDGVGGNEQAQPAPGDDDRPRRARERQQRALDEQRPDEPRAGGPQRRAKRDIAPPRVRAREQQAGHVHTGDGQDHPHRAEQDEQGPARRAQHQVRDRDRVAAEALAVAEQALAQPARLDDPQFGCHAGGRHVRAQAPDADEAPVAPSRVVPRVEIEREPDVAGPVVAEIERQPEPRRHHADHGVRRPVQPQGPADNARVGRESSGPQAVAQHHAFRPGIRGRERPADGGRRPERCEEVGRHQRGADALGLGRARQVCGAAGVGRHLFQARCFPVVTSDLRRGEPRRLALRGVAPDQHDAVGLAVRQGAQHHRFDEREDQRVRTDAERERQRSEQRETGCGEEGARGEPQIECQTLDSTRAAAAAGLVCRTAT